MCQADSAGAGGALLFLTGNTKADPSLCAQERHVGGLLVSLVNKAEKGKKLDIVLCLVNAW